MPPCIAATFLVVAGVSGARPLLMLPHGPSLVAVYWLGLAAVGPLVFRLRARSSLLRASMRLGQPVPLALASLALVTFNFFTFRWNNSLKAVHRDSTGDDAIIEAFRAFAEGHPMYSAVLYDGAPISPGPLWVLANGWLSTLSAHFLMTPLYLLAVLLLLERPTRGLFLILLLSNPLVWVTSGTGHDHVALSLAFLACFLWAQRPDASAARVLSLAVASAVLGTSRVVYLGFPVLLAACAVGLPRRARWWVAGLGVALALGAQAVFIEQNAIYQPAHLLHRGLRNVGIPLMVAGAVGCATVLLVAWRVASAHLTPALCFALALLVPHAAIAVGELITVRGQVPMWEGANYLLPAVPALAYAFVQALLPAAPPSTT